MRLLLLESFGFRSPNKWRSMCKRISVIRSPFVYKKSGETFFFSRHRARLSFRLGSPDAYASGLKFILYLANSSAAYINVELRLFTFSTNNDKSIISR